MIDKISQPVSYIFHPLLIPTYTFAALYYLTPHLVMPLSVMTLPFLFISTFVIPGISLSILRVSGSITSLKLEKREERLTPFVFITLFFGMTSYMFIIKIGVNDLVAIIFASTTLLILFLTLITVFFKISIHAAGMSGFLGYLLCIAIKFPEFSLVYPIMTLIILSGLVMSARLYLNAHSPKEILAGFISGLVVSFNALYWFV